MLPLVLGILFSSFAIGVFSKRIGTCAPWMIAAATLASIGAGLSTRFQQGTEIGCIDWISALLFFGLGAGAGARLPEIGAQKFLDPEDVFVGVGLLQGAYSFGAGIFFAVGQAVFAHSLRGGLPEPLSMGIMLHVASLMRENDPKNVQEADRDSVVVLSNSLRKALYVTVALSCLAVIPALGTEWRRVKAGRRRSAVAARSTGPSMMNRFA